MTLTLVPALFLTLVVILSHPDADTKTKKPPKVKKGPRYEKVEDTRVQKGSDYDTIYKYITNTFRKVKEQDAKQISQHLVDYGKKYKLDPKFAAALIARESAFKKDAVSSTGAKGLGQIKDFNYKSLAINDPFNVGENVSGTVQYLKRMIGKWKESPQQEVKRVKAPEKPEQSKIKLALASYYKGFTNVKRQGVDQKTEAYVDDILSYYDDILQFESVE